MRYRIIGANRETSARMVLEFEAESKAAAERKALQQGMTVNRVEDITDGAPAHAYDVGNRARRSGGGIGKLLRNLIVLAIVVAAAYFLWTRFGRPGL